MALGEGTGAQQEPESSAERAEEEEEEEEEEERAGRIRLRKNAAADQETFGFGSEPDDRELGSDRIAVTAVCVVGMLDES